MRIEELTEDVVDLASRRKQKEIDLVQWRKDNPPACPKCDRQVERLKKFNADDPDWLCMSCMLPIEDKRTP